MPLLRVGAMVWIRQVKGTANGNLYTIVAHFQDNVERKEKRGRKKTSQITLHPRPALNREKIK